MVDPSVAGRTALGRVLPEYEILGELGRGAMGVVLAAKHRSLGRPVAIKELPLAFAADEKVRQRFMQEAQTVAALNHPHVVVVHDFIDRNGHLALIMEHLGGGTVWDRFTSIGVTAPTACALLLSTAAGLDHAHRNGVLHRDVKPENLMFATDGQLKVTDFGMAKVMCGEQTMATADGVVLGTPAYMAPEQAEGKPVGPQADVYACGTLLFELLSGRLPFQAPSAVAMLIARVKDDAPRLSEQAPTVPPAVAEVAEIALARSVVERYLAVEDFAVALGQAAVESWGPDWLTATGVTVVGSEVIERASRTSMRPGRGSQSDVPLRGDGVAPSTMLDGTPKVAKEHRPTLPSYSERTSAPDLTSIAPGEVVDIAQVNKPPNPVVAWAVALALALAAVGAMAVGPSSPVASSEMTIGQTVDADAGSGSEMEPGTIDFTQPFTVTGLGPGSRLRLAASTLGIPLGFTEAELSEGGAVVDPAYLRWTTTGAIELAATIDGEPQPRASITVVPIHPWYLSAPVVAIVLVALWALASLQSNLFGLRRGRVKIGAFIGLTTSGGLLGVTSGWLSSLARGLPLSLPLSIFCAGLVAAAAVAYGEGYRRFRRRSRLRSGYRR